VNRTILAPPEPPPIDFERRRQHLLAEIARSATPRSRPFRVQPLHRRLSLVISLILALTAVGTAFAVSTRLIDFDAFFEYFDRDANHPSIPRLVGDRTVITGDDDWAFVAWKSTRGLCTSLVFPQREGATVCGIPVAGAPPETSGPKRLVVGGTFHGRGDYIWINGVAAADVSRIEVELSDGRRLQAVVYDAPAALRLELKFFLTRARLRVQTRPPDPQNAPRVDVPEPVVRAFSAYDAHGRLLQRFSPAGPR
jgi:hypothetical protein